MRYRCDSRCCDVLYEACGTGNRARLVVNGKGWTVADYAEWHHMTIPTLRWRISHNRCLVEEVTPNGIVSKNNAKPKAHDPKAISQFLALRW